MNALLTAVCILTVAAFCRADSRPPVREPVAHSSDGRFIVRIAEKIQVFELSADTTQYRRLSEFAIGAEEAPLALLVSDDGIYIIAFDCSGYHGKGDAVVVVYRNDGTRLKNWRLDQILSSEDLAATSRSVSNVWWRNTIACIPSQKGSAASVIVRGPDNRFQIQGARRREYEYTLDLTTLRWKKSR